MQSPISKPALGRIHHIDIKTPCAMLLKQDNEPQANSYESTSNFPSYKQSATPTLSVA